MEGMHRGEIESIFQRFHTSPQGLTTKDAQGRLTEYGPNILTETKRKPYIIRFLEQFENFFSVLLIVGAILSFISHSFDPLAGADIIGYALLGVTILNAAFSFFQEYKAEKAMDSFRNMLPQKIMVFRDDALEEIAVSELVPGDIIEVREGDKVPADARVIEEHVLRVDHSMLTGESEPQLRSTKCTSEKELVSRNMLFSATLVIGGVGKAVVVRTGDNTEIGRIAKMTEDVDVSTSKIRNELKDFVKIISGIAIVLGVVFFGLGFIVGRTFWESLIFSIGIIVANVPEGLLPTVTLTLSLSAQKMAKRNALVKDIESIETIGSVTTICTDKTGTLTENNLSVEQIYFDKEFYTYNEYHKMFMTKDKDFLHVESKPDYELVLECMHLCNNSTVRADGHEYGDPTETALKRCALSQGKETNAKREEEIPFDSVNKYMITANETSRGRIAYMKGSPESVFRKCKHVRVNNRNNPLTQRMQQNLLRENDHLAIQGRRVLALAYKPLGDEVANQKHLERDDFILLGFVSLVDPPRPEVKGAVAQCYTAGINIVVISGDQGTTVKAIAEEVGIIGDQDHVVITSDDLAEMKDYEVKQQLHANKVIFARALPQDKLRIVTLLQEMGQVVAVTGDGVNDAPALKKADVGVAMGKSGTDVAKDAANIVLLDDNFATIVEAIKTGRTVFDNIKKFIIYILTSNIPEIIPFLLFVLFGWPLALPVLLILAIDLGTDVLPAIALGMESSEDDIMKRSPRSRSEKLLTKAMLFRSYGVIGPLQTVFAYISFFAVLFTNGWTWGVQLAVKDPIYIMAVSAFFGSIIVTQVFNHISCRTIRMSTFKKPLFANKFMAPAILMQFALLAFLVFFPHAQNVFGTGPFPFYLISYMLLGGVVMITLEEGRKYLYRKYGLFDVF